MAILFTSVVIHFVLLTNIHVRQVAKRLRLGQCIWVLA
jgi:hypothetical protein